MELSPSFASGTTAYTATTTDEANAVTATATDDDCEIEIMLGTTEIENGGDATWGEGSNTLTITVSNLGKSTVYTVTVTKS